MNLNEFLANIQSHALWVGVAFALVCIAMIIDLITGINKANKKGEATTSKGLRRTCNKAMKYFLPILSCACIDLMLSALPIYTIPLFTVFFSVFCLICETKSVFENTRSKDEAKESARVISELIKAKDDSSELLKMVLKNIIDDKDNPVTSETVIGYLKDEKDNGN